MLVGFLVSLNILGVGHGMYKILILFHTSYKTTKKYEKLMNKLTSICIFLKKYSWLPISLGIITLAIYIYKGWFLEYLAWEPHNTHPLCNRFDISKFPTWEPT